MSDSKFKTKKIIYITIGILIMLIAIILLILGILVREYEGKTLIIISCCFFGIGIIYSISIHFIINELKNRFKEIVLQPAFLAYRFDYFSRQKGLIKNPYIISKEDFDKLDYYKANDDFVYKANELVVGEMRSVSFRSMDYEYKNEESKAMSKGRIYAFRLKSDPNFKLFITKNEKSMKKIEMNYFRKYNIYSNDEEKAKSIIKQEFFTKIEKLEKYGDLYFEINNDVLYLIINKKKSTFDVSDNETYETFSYQVEDEVIILNNVIESFKFPVEKPKQKELKIR